MAQSGKCPALDFSSGHDHPFCGIEPHIGLHTDSTEPSWDPLSLPLPCLCSFSLSQNKLINLKNKKEGINGIIGNKEVRHKKLKSKMIDVNYIFSIIN